MHSLSILLAVAILGAGCRPTTVAEAEERGNVSYLVKRGDKDSILALGRLADKNAEAERALSTRAPSEAVSTAAWQGVLRNSPWAEKIIRRDLAGDSADVVAMGMTPADTHLGAFVVDLETALSRLTRGGSHIALMLASIGPSARPVVERRMRDATTRDTMCSAIDLPSASDDARTALLALPQTERDSLACTSTIIRMAAVHANVLEWLGTTAEPGLLSLAGRDTLPCAALAETIKIVIAQRSVEPPSARALVVPIRHAIERCAKEVDPVLSTSLTARPQMANTVAAALDPRATSTADMKQTCAWIQGRQAQITDRATVANLLATGCKAALANR